MALVYYKTTIKPPIGTWYDDPSIYGGVIAEKFSGVGPGNKLMLLDICRNIIPVENTFEFEQFEE